MNIDMMEGEMKILIKADKFLKELTVVKFVSLMTILDFVMTMSTIGVNYLLSGTVYANRGEGGYDSVKETLFVLLLFAPFSETMIYQFGLIRFMKWFKKGIFQNNCFVILISALIFALVHGRGWYNIPLFLSGIILAYSFVVYEEKKNSSFGVVCCIHFFMNVNVITASLIAYGLGMI